LAAKFNTASINDIQSLQEVFLRATPEEQLTIISEIPKQSDTKENATVSDQKPPTPPNFDEFVGLGFYFDNDVPKSGSESYLDTYNSYVGKKITYLNNTIEPNKDSVTIFFNDIIENNFDKIQNNETGLIKKIADAFKTNSIKDMSISFEGSASASASVQYNANLSQRRIESVKKYFEQFQIGSGDNIISINEYIENGKLNINTQPVGELATNVTPIGNNGSSVTVAKCTDNPIIGGKSITGPNSIYLTQSMACRSVRIKSISFTPADPVEVVKPPAEQRQEVAELPGPKQSIKPLPATEARRIPGLSKKVLRMLLSECNYFQAIEQDTPFLYQSLKEKLKFFSPSFHSTTPEGLNSRLTFLNQCLRPGDTIPTIGNDGRPIYNDAINTAFGRPPVLVLRIGDFYNTKIIPRSIQFSYDPLVLDMNREGIGVQPMIADVTLSFDFIGGHGLARPVEELQNALSFNYYANTEIYDERATATEDVSNLDAIIEKSIVERPIPTTVQNKIQNSGGKTIGNILTTNSDGVNFSGTVDYREFLTTNNDTLQDYFINVFETSKSISETYNFYLWQYINTNREFINGDITNNNTKIFGRPKNTDEIINKLSEDVITSIDDGTNIIVSGFTQRGFQEPVVRQVKQRLIDFINKIVKPNVSVGLSQQLQNILTKENALISNIGKINYIYSYYDGFVKNDGTPLVYNLTGQTISSFDGITPILSGVTTDLNDYYDLVRNEKIVFDYNNYESVLLIENGGNITNENEEKFFTMMSPYFVDDNNLKILSDYIFPNGNVIGSVEVNTPEPPKNFFDTLIGLTSGGVNPINSRYKNTNKVLNKTIDDFSENKDYRQKYEKYTNYRKIGNGINLELIYSTTPTPPDSAKNDLKKLYQSVPTGGDKFNGKIL
jgi:outer membrane protein OmpA-like peptidoglycan-associated protein